MKPENTERMTKWRTDSIYKPSDLNTHDPDNLHAWGPEPVSTWVWVGRALFCLGLFVGSYVLTLLTFLF